MSDAGRVALAEIIAQIDAIIQKAKRMETEHTAQLQKVHPNYRKSALNLVHYREQSRALAPRKGGESRDGESALAPQHPACHGRLEAGPISESARIHQTGREAASEAHERASGSEIERKACPHHGDHAGRGCIEREADPGSRAVGNGRGSH